MTGPGRQVRDHQHPTARPPARRPLAPGTALHRGGGLGRADDLRQRLVDERPQRRVLTVGALAGARAERGAGRLGRRRSAPRPPAPPGGPDPGPPRGARPSAPAAPAPGAAWSAACPDAAVTVASRRAADAGDHPHPGHRQHRQRRARHGRAPPARDPPRRGDDLCSVERRRRRPGRRVAEQRRDARLVGLPVFLHPVPRSACRSQVVQRVAERGAQRGQPVRRLALHGALRAPEHLRGRRRRPAPPGTAAPARRAGAAARPAGRRPARAGWPHRQRDRRPLARSSREPRSTVPAATAAATRRPPSAPASVRIHASSASRSRILRQCRCRATNAACAWSSARCQSPHRRYAVRRTASRRARKYASNSCSPRPRSAPATSPGRDGPARAVARALRHHPSRVVP